MGNLVEHAKRELELLGEDEWTITNYIKMIEVFSEMGHSGGSASVFIPTLNALLQYENLTPLTDDEDEWTYHGPDLWNGTEGIWQSRRNPVAFSHDEGKTYWFVNADVKEFHESKKKEV